MLDKPRVNFAISERGSGAGENHLGLQVDSDAQLDEVHGRLEGAGGAIVEERDVSCCYARSDKYWITDPQGVAWETFRSLGTVPFYSQAETGETPSTDACCAPEPGLTTAMLPKVSAKSCCAPATATGAGNACC